MTAVLTHLIAGLLGAQIGAGAMLVLVHRARRRNFGSPRGGVNAAHEHLREEPL